MLSGGCAGPKDIVVDAAEAASAGDRDAYLDCFTGRSQSLMRAMLQVAGTEHGAPFQLTTNGDPVKVVSVQGLPADRHASERVLVTVTEGAEALGLVVHRVGTQWRIDLVDTERLQGGAMESILLNPGFQ